MTAPPRLALGVAAGAPALLMDLLKAMGLQGAPLVGKDAHGRPTLCVEGERLALSRSRASGHCAVAVALTGRIGVDLVALEGNDLSLLEAHFHPSEKIWLKAKGEPDRNLALAQCWAAKEAVLKALGLGLGLGLDAVELIPDEHSQLRILRIAGQGAEGWNLALSRAENLVVALAWAP